MTETSADIGKAFLEGLIGNVVYTLEIIITIIIVGIIVITLISILRAAISSLRKRDGKFTLRIDGIVARLLRGLLISLDILVATDILTTILVPSLQELAKLVVIVIVRVLLTFSLSKEMERQEKHSK